MGATASATATMDVRLVKGVDPQRTAQRVIDHIRKQRFFVVDQEPGVEVRMAHPKVERTGPGGAHKSSWRFARRDKLSVGEDKPVGVSLSIAPTAGYRSRRLADE